MRWWSGKLQLDRIFIDELFDMLMSLFVNVNNTREQHLSDFAHK